MLVDADPERFFMPPYVGHRGWLGVRLDRGLDWDELAGIAEDAYAEVAPAKLVEAARADIGEVPVHEAGCRSQPGGYPSRAADSGPSRSAVVAIAL